LKSPMKHRSCLQILDIHFTFMYLSTNSEKVMNYSVVKIPVSPVAKKYYEFRFHHKIDDTGYIKVDKNHSFGMLVISFLDLWWDRWELPTVTGPVLRIKIPSIYMKYGIPARKLKDLANILEAEAMEYLVNEIANAAAYPGISVTEAILSVMSRYDISDEEYRTDSMRRHFDRYCGEVKGQPFKEFSHKVNATIKKLYEKLAESKKDLEYV